MRLKVLVVDDEPLAREGLKLLLGRQSGVESVSEARNGREAIALIREPKPDLVLLDVQMPRIDGFAVVHAIGAERMPAGDLRHRARPVCDPRVRDRGARLPAQAGHRGALRARVQASRRPAPGRAARGRRRARSLAMLDAVANPPRRLERFAVRSGERTIFVPVDEVDWIEALPELRPAARRARRRTCCTCR